MKHKALFLTLIVLLLAIPLGVGAKTVYPDIIPLANGLTPEGITLGTGNTFYHGTITGGAIFRGSLRTGEVEPLVPPDPSRLAVGLAFDRRTNLLYVSGGFLGSARVYDVSDGSEVAFIQLAAPFDSWINDAVVTRDAVYFTDSFLAMLYRLPLDSGGRLPDPIQFEPIPLTGDYVLLPQPGLPDYIINANGIVATPEAEWLMVVHTAVGDLYRVDPQTGYAMKVDLGDEDVLFGDGLVLRGHTLYVVQNFLNQIRVVELDPEFASGTVVEDLTSDAFRIPTTAVIHNNALYAVNARFDEIDPLAPPPGAEFEIVRVDINQ